MELDSAFAEKIVMKNDNEFHCKDCPIFVTSIRLLARTRAQSCSSKKKKAGCKPKKIYCAECGAACEGRKGLANHFKVSHIISSYNCAQCPKTFKCRKNFANRLKIHDETVGVKCPHCPAVHVGLTILGRTGRASRGSGGRSSPTPGRVSPSAY